VRIDGIKGLDRTAEDADGREGKYEATACRDHLQKANSIQRHSTVLTLASLLFSFAAFALMLFGVDLE
jgi:hypothetical protein